MVYRQHHPLMPAGVKKKDARAASLIWYGLFVPGLPVLTELPGR